VGMINERKFCPTCKAFTMEPADGMPLTKEEYDRVEVGPLVFQGKLKIYQCPVCTYVLYEPVL
jgi:hypothetical protein